jgi:hypothetical protein
VPAKLGSHSFRLAPPRAATLRVKLSARARHGLQRLRRVTFSIQVIAKDAAGNARSPTVLGMTVRR